MEIGPEQRPNCSFTFRERAERAGSSARERHFDWLGRDRDGLMLDIFCNGAFSWTGVFAFGDTNHNAAYLLPDAWLFVVSRGQGYFVDAAMPSRWKLFPIVYVKGTLPTGSSGSVVAYTNEGLFVVWSHDRVGERSMDADGFYDVRVIGDHVTGMAERVSLGGVLEPFSLLLSESDFHSSAWTDDSPVPGAEAVVRYDE